MRKAVKGIGLNSQKTHPKIPLKFLYGFLHKSSGYLEYRFIKLSAFFQVLSHVSLKTFSAIVCYKSRFLLFSKSFLKCELVHIFSKENSCKLIPPHEIMCIYRERHRAAIIQTGVIL